VCVCVCVSDTNSSKPHIIRVSGLKIRV